MSGGLGPEQGSGGKSFIGSTAFWIIAGVVVAGAGAATFFAFQKGSPTAASFSPVLGCEGTADGRCH